MRLTSEARKHLLGLEYPALLEARNAIDRRGKKRPGIRDLGMADRFYLLTQVCHRQDMLGHGMEWLFKRCREVEKESVQSPLCGTSERTNGFCLASARRSIQAPWA